MTDFAERYRQLRDAGRSPEDAYREAQQADITEAVAKPVRRFGVVEPGVTMGRAEPATASESEATRVNLAKGRPRNFSERVGGLLNQVAAGSAEGLPWIPAVPVLGAVNIYSAAREALPFGRLPDETPNEPYLSRVKRRIEGNPLGKAVHGVLAKASEKATDVFGAPQTGAESVARLVGSAVTPTAIAGKAARTGKALVRTVEEVAPKIEGVAGEAIGAADAAAEKVRFIRKTMGMSGKVGGGIPEEISFNWEPIPGSKPWVMKDAKTGATFRKFRSNEEGSAWLEKNGYLAPEPPSGKEGQLAPGEGAVPIMGGTAGAIGGAAVGATQGDTPEERIKNALLLGGAGAVGGAAVGRAAEKVGGKVATAATDLPPIGERGSLGAPAAREYVNTPRFGDLNAEGRKLLDDVVLQTAARANRIPKERVPWDQVKAEGAELLKSNPERLYTLKPSEVGGKEAYAISTLVQGKIDQLTEVNAALLKATDHAEIGNLTKQAASLESESSQLLDKLMKGTSQQGRDLNANKILAGLTNDPVTWLLKATRAADRPLTDLERSTILGHLNRGERAEMLRFVGHLQPQTLAQKGVTIWKAGLLTNPSTHAANISGNTTLAVAEEFAKQPAAAADWLMGLATKIRTKKATSPRQLGAQFKGATEGAADIPDILKGLPVGDDVTYGLIPRESKLGNAITTAFVNGPFRLLNAEDRVFGAAAYKGSLAEQAEILAKTEGHKGPARKARILDLIENPTDEMAIRASEDALVRTFKDRTPVGEALQGVQSKLGTVGNVILPFTRTPGAVGTRLGEYTPYGMVKGSFHAARAVLRIRKAIKAAEPVTPELKRLQQVAAETLGRGMTGTGLMAAGYYLYQSGAYTGVRPSKDKGLADTKEAAGIPNDAFRVGKGYIEPNRIGIPAMLMTLGAAIGEARAAGEDESVGAGFGQALASFVRIITDQPFLRGATDLQRIREDPIDAGSSYVRNLAGSTIPAGVAAAARATDPTMRETRSIGDVFKSRIPGLSDNLPARRNFLGDEQPRQAPGVLNNMVTPFRLSKDNLGDPLLNAVVASGATITKLGKRSGESGADYSTRSQEVGARLRETLGAVTQDPGYKRLPQDQQGQVIERMSSGLRGDATKQQQALRYQAYRDQGMSAEEAYAKVRADFNQTRKSSRVGALLARP